MDTTQPDASMMPPQPMPMPPQAPTPPQADTVPEISDPSLPSKGPNDAQMIALKNLMEQINIKYSNLLSTKATSKSKIQKVQSEVLRQVFDTLQSLGVDPSNVNDVQNFLNKIKDSNPELYKQINQALLVIMGDDAGPETNPGQIEQSFNQQDPNAMDPAQVPATNMNIDPNDTPQQNI